MRNASIRVLFAGVGLLGCMLTLAGCARTKPTMPAPPPPKVTVIRPVWETVQSYYEYNGYLEPIETVQIRARVKGILKEVNFTEGVEVKKDDPLYQIDPREYKSAVKKAEADIASAVAQLKKARSEEARAKEIYATRAISAEEYLSKVVAAESADAMVKLNQAMLDTAKIQEGYTTIVSPISGRISRTLVTPGNLVGQNEATLLTTIVSVDPLYVYFDVPERDLVEYQRDSMKEQLPDPTSRKIDVEIGVETEDGFPHVGKIDFRENRVDSGTGTVRIRGRIPNPLLSPGNTRLLYPGLYSRVRVPAGDPTKRLVIPEEALMTGQEGRYVYVVDENNIVQKRTVTVGTLIWRPRPAEEEPKRPGWTVRNPNPAPPPNDGKTPPQPSTIPLKSVIAINKGLKEGDRVIVNGLQRARPLAPVAPDEWEFKGPPKTETK